MEKIHADLIGIGKLLMQTRFSVPPHQRPYAWVEEQVNDLYSDINDVQKRKSEEYFLGTIVLASADDGRVSNHRRPAAEVVAVSISPGSDSRSFRPRWTNRARPRY